MRKSTQRARRGRVDVVEVFTQPKKSIAWQIAGMVIRARAELFLLAVTVLAMVWLRARLEPLAVNLVLIGLVLVVFALPWSRRFVVARMWCVIDRHRLRTCLRQTKVRTMNMDGSLPFLLWARPTKTGERVWVWIRAGSSGDDIEDALNYIAPACFAREARLYRVRKLTTIVAVEVIRRDPLAKPTPIASPLARLTARFTGTAVTTEGTEPIRAASITDITAAPSAAASAPKTQVKKTTKTAVPVAPVPAAVVNGEDLSDYVD
jgi:hypothetical protein